MTEQNGRSEAGKKSIPASIERYLKDINYPASKEDLVEQAKKNNAPDDVMKILNQFSDQDYRSPIDVSKEVGRIE